MGIASDLTKLQERKEALLKEVALIDREFESVALALGVRPRPASAPVAGMAARPPRSKRPNGELWAGIEFWLRSQIAARTSREISEGTMLGLATVATQLTKHRLQLIHRGNRYGLSETQFADHTAELEEERRGEKTQNPSTSPTAHSLNGATDSLSALTITANTPLVDTAPVRQRDIV